MTRFSCAHLIWKRAPEALCAALRSFTAVPCSSCLESISEFSLSGAHRGLCGVTELQRPADRIRTCLPCDRHQSLRKTRPDRRGLKWTDHIHLRSRFQRWFRDESGRQAGRGVLRDAERRHEAEAELPRGAAGQARQHVVQDLGESGHGHRLLLQRVRGRLHPGYLLRILLETQLSEQHRGGELHRVHAEFRMTARDAVDRWTHTPDRLLRGDGEYSAWMEELFRFYPRTLWVSFCTSNRHRNVVFGFLGVQMLPFCQPLSQGPIQFVRASGHRGVQKTPEVPPDAGRDSQKRSSRKHLIRFD